MSLLSERDWQQEFEDITADPNQNPHRVYSEDEVEWLGPAVVEGTDLREVIERYQALKRDMEDYG